MKTQIKNVQSKQSKSANSVADYCKRSPSFFFKTTTDYVDDHRRVPHRRIFFRTPGPSGISRHVCVTDRVSVSSQTATTRKPCSGMIPQRIHKTIVERGCVADYNVLACVVVGRRRIILGVRRKLRKLDFRTGTVSRCCFFDFTVISESSARNRKKGGNFRPSTRAPILVRVGPPSVCFPVDRLRRRLNLTLSKRRESSFQMKTVRKKPMRSSDTTRRRQSFQKKFIPQRALSRTTTNFSDAAFS